MEHDRLVLSIPAARRVLGGIGKTMIYELINQKKLEKIKIGGRSFVTRSSVEKLVLDSRHKGLRASAI